MLGSAKFRVLAEPKVVLMVFEGFGECPFGVGRSLPVAVCENWLDLTALLLWFVTS